VVRNHFIEGQSIALSRQHDHHRYLSERSMTLVANTTTNTKEVAQARTNDGMINPLTPHGVEKLHHSAGRHRLTWWFGPCTCPRDAEAKRPLTWSGVSIEVER